MSGGHWDYSGGRIQHLLECIAEDPSVKERWPILSQLLAELGEVLYQCEHDMDWDLSSDAPIKDDATWEAERIGDILELAMKAAPDAWFPRGKWATIQAVQCRKESP